MSQPTNGRVVHIYGLCDPTTTQLRYVGKSDNPLIRLQQHTKERRRKTPLYDWIASIQPHQPELFVIETVPAEQWQESEQFRIAYFKSIGCRLLNIAKGGDQPHPTADQLRTAAREATKAREAGPLAAMWHRKRRLVLMLRQAERDSQHFATYHLRFLLGMLAAAHPQHFGEWGRK